MATIRSWPGRRVVANGGASGGVRRSTIVRPGCHHANGDNGSSPALPGCHQHPARRRLVTASRAAACRSAGGLSPSPSMFSEARPYPLPGYGVAAMQPGLPPRPLPANPAKAGLRGCMAFYAAGEGASIRRSAIRGYGSFSALGGRVAHSIGQGADLSTGRTCGKPDSAASLRRASVRVFQ